MSQQFRVVVAGGGSAGLTLANRLSRRLGRNSVALIEPKDVHYYQPMWTLVGGGLKKFEQSVRPMSQFISSAVHWEKQSVASFEPESNQLVLENGNHLGYEYLIVALGIVPDYNRIQGLYEALETVPNVCTNYDPRYVNKTYPAIRGTSKGTALFTHPDTPIKCAGAPQKILYLAEHDIRSRGVRDNVEVTFAHSGPAIFGVKRYAEQLSNCVTKKGIKTHFQHVLKKIDHQNNVAYFDDIKDPENPEKIAIPYEMIHVSPPFKPPPAIATNATLSAASGYLDVNIQTLQHNKFKNIFGAGDNVNITSTKTAAAAAAQTGIIEANLDAVMKGKEPRVFYDGYTSCPLVTGANKGILAEFDINGQPLETFPSFVGQHKERRIWYFMKAHVMSHLYWYGMIKGPWRGPAGFRKLFSVFGN